jgi:exopolyphosphatase/guanosine-5'-triphosphate,3'-diphosphate pyrophosphatase
MAVGLDLEVLDPTEESRLTVSAVRDVVRDALDMARRFSLIVSVGGGSTLLTLLNDGVIVASESHSLGSVRFQEMLVTPHEPLERETELLRRQVANTAHMIARSMPMKKVRSAVLVGEEAQVAARHGGEKVDEAGHVYTINRQAFDGLVNECSSEPPTALARRFALPLPNAERLVPAMLIHQALLALTKVEKTVVCDVSMADGLLLDMARRACGEEDTEFDEAVIRSATSIGEKYRYDAEHAAHVAALALFLFDELQPEHRLTPRHRLLLRVAAILHEVGRFVNSRAHHKHTYYLVSNAEIFGLGRHDIEVAALVARYHRRAQPRRTHPEYMTLNREDRMAVSKLAAILRVADALERGHAQQVRDIRIERRPAELVITAPDVSDLTLERRGLAQKADLFEDTFGMKVRLEEVQSGPTGPAARPVE